MLDKLFGSKTRVKLLKLFLLHPADKFYTREIARQLGLQLNSIHRELANLEELGLIIASAIEKENKEDNIPALKKKVSEKNTSKDKKYYQVNIGFAFYKEIKALIVKSQILYEDDFASKLKKAGKIKLMILTGIFLNEFDADVDLFLVGDFDRKKLIKAIRELERDLVKEVNYSIMTAEEFKYRREIADIFIYNILDNNKIVVIDEDNIL